MRAHTLFKIQTRACCVLPRVHYISGKKQCMVVWRALWLSPSPEWVGPYMLRRRNEGYGASDFLELASREEIKESRREPLSKPLLYISGRAFSRIRGMSWWAGHNR